MLIVIMNYGLYQTFCGKAKHKRDISEKQKKELSEKMGDLTPEQQEAIFMLTIEHARLNDDYVIPTNQTESCSFENPPLPYEIKYKKGNIQIALSKLPIDLKWILLNFIKQTEKIS
jgi:hypothetical protein